MRPAVRWGDRCWSGGRRERRSVDRQEMMPRGCRRVLFRRNPAGWALLAEGGDALLALVAGEVAGGQRGQLGEVVGHGAGRGAAQQLLGGGQRDGGALC